jgi:hypothetical protein
MSNVAASVPSQAPSSSKSSSRLTRDQASRLVDAKTVAAAVTKYLPLFEAADADRAVKRVGAGWLARYTSMMNAAETAVDGRAVRLGEQKAVTSAERADAVSLANELRAIRDDITTSYPGDEGIGRAFGLGGKIDQKKTGALLLAAGQVAQAFASKQWSARAVAAGVTQARIDALAAARAALSGADVSQQGLFATNVDGTVQKDALLKAVNASTAYARKVAAVVLKGNAAALAAFAPARARVAKKGKPKPAAAAASGGATPAKAKPTKKVARGKLRARRAQVQTRAKSLMVGPTASAPVAKKAKAAKKATKAKVASKRAK